MDPVKTTIATYNQIAEDYSNAYFDYYQNNLELIDAFVKPLPPKAKILDAGCSSGGISKYLSEKGYIVVGIDLSEKMLELARKQVPNVEFMLMDLREISLPDHSFDAIIADFSLLHIPKHDMPRTLKGFNSILKPNGMLFLSIFEGEGERFIQEPFKPTEKAFWNFFTQEELIKDLQNANFEITHDVKKETKAEEEFLSIERFVFAKKLM